MISTAPPTPITANRFDNVEIIRGLASVFVVLFHFRYYAAPESWTNKIFQYGYLGVDAFFIISGFVLPLSFAQKNYTIADIRPQILRRIIRIEPAYWASIFLCFIKDAIYEYSLHKKVFALPDTYSFKSLVLHLFHVNGFFSMTWIRELYWTLAIDWQFYLFLCVTFFLINRREWWLRYPIYIIIASTYLMVPANNVWASFYCFDFIAGIMFFHFTRNYVFHLELLAMWSALLCVVYLKMGINHFCSISTVCFVLYFVKAGTDWFRVLGKISYSLYLTHAFSGWTLISIAALYYPHLDETVKAFIIFTAVLVSIPFAYWFYLLVEKPTAVWAKN